MSKNSTICIIGVGHLGSSIMKRLLGNGHEKLIVTRRNNEELERISIKYPKVEITHDNKEAVEKSDIIILATKQDSFEEIANEIRRAKNGKLLISLGPTWKLEKLERFFGPKNVRLISPIDGSDDIICYTTGNGCDENDDTAVKYVFGENALKVTEAEMPTATAYVLFRGILNSFLEPFYKLDGFDDELARKIFGRMLISVGKEIEAGLEADYRLENASAGRNESTFTMELYNKLASCKEEFAEKFRSTCKTFNDIENG